MGSLSNYYSALQGLLTKMSPTTLRGFADCQSDEERVTYVGRLDGVRNAFNRDAAMPVPNKLKNSEDARKWRERGNGSYQQNQMADALMSYNMSIVLAPRKEEAAGTDEESQDLLALAIGNRSAVFWQLQRYEDCAEDTQLAIESGYPDELRYKLYERRGRCFQKMKQHKRATRAFKKAVELLSRAKLDEAKLDSVLQQLQHEITNSRDLHDVAKVIPPSPAHLDVPSIASDHANQRYPSAAKSLDINYQGARGRYAIAIEDVGVGDVVAVESPYVSVLDKDFYHSHCYHCFQATDRPVACQQCSRVRYCSSRCAAQSWSSYHRWECSQLDALLSSGTGSIGHVALRAILHSGINKIIHCKRNPKSQRTSIHNALYTDSNGVYLTGYVGIHNLVSHSTDRSSSDLLQYTFLAVFLQEILTKSGFFATAKDQTFNATECVGGLLLRFLQVISCNGLEITRLQTGANLLKCYPQTLGLALYPTISLFNHSCNPAMELIFYGQTCVARALRTVPKGHELTIDYGYIYYLQTREQRQLSLSTQYFFNCSCEACSGDWGLKPKLPSGIANLKCTKCTRALPSLTTARDQDPAAIRCSFCRQTQNGLMQLEDLHLSSQDFEKALVDALNWKVGQSLPVLASHMTAMDNLVCQPWKEYASCVSILKQCYRALGNTDEKLRMLVEAEPSDGHVNVDIAADLD